MFKRELDFIDRKRGVADLLVRLLIKKGYKEKVFKLILLIMACVKFQTGKESVSLLCSCLERVQMRYELRVNRFMKTPKKQKGRPKLRGRLFFLDDAFRVRRRTVRNLIESSMLRRENNIVNQIVEEILDMSNGKGIMLRKKQEFIESIYNARATMEIVKRHRRVKRISRQ